MSDNARYSVYLKRKSLTTSNTTATFLFTLPEGAIPVHTQCFTTATATSAELDVGTADDTDKYVDGLDVSTVGKSDGTLLNQTQLTCPTDIYGLIGGSPSSGGPFMVEMYWVTVKSTPVLY